MVQKIYQEIIARRQSLFPDSRIRKFTGDRKIIAGGGRFCFARYTKKLSGKVFMSNRRNKYFEGLDTELVRSMVALQRAGGWSVIGGFLCLVLGAIAISTALSTDNTTAACIALFFYGLPGIYLIVSGLMLNSLKFSKSYLTLLIINTFMGGITSIFCGLAIYKLSIYLKWKSSKERYE